MEDLGTPTDGCAPFRLVHETTLDTAMSPFESIAALSGESSRRFLLTTQGRILIVDEEWRVLSEAKLPMQKKASPEQRSQLIYVGVTGVLVALFHGTLAFINIDSDHSVIFTRRDVRMVSVSASGTAQSWPDHEFAYVTTKNQVVQSILRDGQEKQVWKHRPDQAITALCLEGPGLCFTTLTDCFVRQIDSDAPLTSAFPVLPPNDGEPSNPTLCHVDEGEFCVGGAMPGMVIFVDCSGQAKRQPIHLHTNHMVRCVVRTERTLLVLTETALQLFDNSPNGQIRQEIALPTPITFIATIGNLAVLFARPPKADVYGLQEIDWLQKAAEMLEGGKFEAALEIVHSNTPENDEQTVMVNEVRVQVGLHRLKAGDTERGAELLLLGKVAPCEVEGAFVAIFSPEDSPEDKYSDVVLIKELIGRVREEEWAAGQEKEWNTLQLILDCRLIESPPELPFLIHSVPSYEAQTVAEYLEGRKMTNARLALMTERAIRRLNEETLESVLSLEWLDKSLHPQIDRVLYLHYLKLVPESSSLDISTRFTFVAEDESGREALVEFLLVSAVRFDRNIVLPYFADHEKELDVLSVYFNGGKHDAELRVMLARLISERLLNDDEPSSRRFLIGIILTHGKDRGEMREIVKGDKAFEVEDAVAENVERPDEIIRSILTMIHNPHALPAIQQVIMHFKSSHPKLPLLFLQRLKDKCDSDPETAAAHKLPDVMYTLIQSAPELLSSGALIDIIPEKSALNTFSALLGQEVLAVHNSSIWLQFGRALAEKIAAKEGPDPSTISVTVTERTLCSVCSKGFSTTSSIHYLPTGFLVHARCHPHLNICPVTNKIFKP